MGLDVFAVLGTRPDGFDPSADDADWSWDDTNDEHFDGTEALLRGGWGADVPHAFRGKAYWQAIERVSGRSLYEEVDAAGVQHIFKALMTSTNDDLELGDSPHEAWALRQWFKVAAEHGYSLSPWF